MISLWRTMELRDWRRNRKRAGVVGNRRSPRCSPIRHLASLARRSSVDHEPLSDSPLLEKVASRNKSLNSDQYAAGAGNKKPPPSLQDESGESKVKHD